MRKTTREEIWETGKPNQQMEEAHTGRNVAARLSEVAEKSVSVICDSVIIWHSVWKH